MKKPLILLAKFFLGPDAPPPGFIIVSNGKRWRWAWEDTGSKSLVDRLTYRGACRAAWRIKRDEDKTTWRRVERQSL